MKLNRIRRVRGRLAAIGTVVLVLGAVACSAVTSRLDSQAAPTSAPPAAAQNVLRAQPAVPAALPAPAGAAAADTTARSSAAANGGGSAASTVPDVSASQSLDRMVIRTAQLSVEVADMEQSLAQARQIAARGGGFVSAANTHFEKINEQNRMVADLTIQVRSDSADAALSDLRALGKVTTEASGSQDVTEEYVDLGSNLRNLQASETAILKLMDKATQIQDVLSLQRELTNVRGQIERIQGRKTYLERRSDMATITLSLRPPAVEASAPVTGAWNPFGVAQRGWQASLTVLRTLAEVVIVVASFSWWLLPFVGLGGYILLQRRRRTPASPPPAAPVEV